MIVFLEPEHLLEISAERTRAAALLHSLDRNHALVDGNAPLAWLATCGFLDLNSVVLEAPDDDAFNLVLPATAGEADVLESAEELGSWCRS